MVRLLSALLIGFAISQVGTLATTIYLHRTLAHRSLRLSPGVTFAFRVIIWITTGIKPREWVAVHRRHHAFADVEGDPHSPKLLGWARVQFTNTYLYRQTARDGVTVPRYTRDLPPDRWDRMLFDHGWLGLAILFGLLALVLGPLWAGIAFLSHVVCYLLLNAAINAITHTFGRQPYDSPGTNLRWLAWITAGEGLHNNHHAAPTTAKLAFHRGEIDPAWPLIRLLRGLGWAVVRHQDPPFASQPEVARRA